MEMKEIGFGELLSHIRLSSKLRGVFQTFDEALAYLNGFMYAWEMDRNIDLEQSELFRFGKWLIARKLPDDATPISSVLGWDQIFKEVVKDSAVSDQVKLDLLRRFYLEFEADTDWVEGEDSSGLNPFVPI